MISKLKLERIAKSELQTEFGKFDVAVYFDKKTKKEHVALTCGNFLPGKEILVRIHSECLTGDVFHSLKCDCGAQLDLAMKKISKEGAGAIIYLRQEGRDIGLANKIKAYELQDKGMDTVEANLKLGFPADARTYETAARILTDIGVMKIMLLTNNPMKIEELEKYGIKVTGRAPLEIKPCACNRRYLKTKKKKLGHILRYV